MSDKEHTVAPLRHTEVLSVKTSPRARIPELVHELEPGGERVSVVKGKQAGHVLENEPGWLESINHLESDKGQVAARVGKPKPSPRDTETLAGASKDKKVNCIGLAPIDLGDIAKVRDVREMGVVYGRSEAVDLSAETPVEILSRTLRGTDA